MTEGMYLYCIADTTESALFGPIGIDSNEVFAFSHEDLSVMTHIVGSLSPFQNEDKARQCIEAHHGVVDKAMKKYKTVLPFALGTIIRGGQAELRAWLKTEYSRLQQSICRMRGKAEYGVRIFWFPSHEAQVASHKTLMELKDKSEGSSGSAYLYRQRFEKELKSVLEQRAKEKFLGYFEKIKACVSEIAVEKIKDGPSEKKIFLHVSCLADLEQVKVLGDLLETIQNQGNPVQFTGPWPPYAFSR